MEDFFLRALFGGAGVALIAGPVGCLVLWRRMVYFGAALAHSTLLGVALAFVLDINATLGILAVCLCLGFALVGLERQHLWPSDTVLGVLAHATLALGLLMIAFVKALRVDLMGYLFGDILAIGDADLVYIFALAVIGLATLALIWRPLLSMTVDEELAAIEGVPVIRVHLIFVSLLAVLIAVAMKVVGMLLILALLIIPAAAARRLSKSPEQMAIIAVVLGEISVILGLFGSLEWDLPSGPLIVVVAMCFFIAVLAATWVRSLPGRVRRHENGIVSNP
ncbi:MAG TPA: metal ABC transporter permease [Gammaproteobacteria bacterium]|nr:metal ABC transporter permease [Gammaproteobacteria bacterium]